MAGVCGTQAFAGAPSRRESPHHRIHFTIPRPGVQSSVWPDGTLSLVIPLQNDGDRLAAHVTISDVVVPSADYLGPNPLPVLLGDLVPEGILSVDAHFSGARIASRRRYPILVRGRYAVGGRTYKFHVLGFVTPVRPSREPIVATDGTTSKFTALTATFPPEPPPPSPEREFNGICMRSPLGPERNLFPAPPPAVNLDRFAAFNPGETPPAGGNANSVVFTRNAIDGNYFGFPPDPSVAGADTSQFVLFSANTAVSYSTDGGKTFKTQNLTGIYDPAIPGRASFFPQDDGGVCCDQVLTYVPSRNIFVWLLQYWQRPIMVNGQQTTGPNRLRIAWATPQDAAADFLHAWTWVDLTSDGFGIGNDWMDYPDLAYSDNFLYVGVDHGIPFTGQVYSARHIFARLDLNQMVDPNSPSVAYSFMDPIRNGLVQNHIVQSSHDTFFWSALPDTSTLTVYAWPDSSDSATSHDIPITSWSNFDYNVLAPDSIPWIAAPINALGATEVDPAFLCPPDGCVGPTRFLYFAFTAGRNSAHGRPYPYVRVAKVDRDTFTLVGEFDIWNPGFAFTTPALVWRPGNPHDEVALSLALGGPNDYADNAVGFLGDGVVYVTTDSDTTQSRYNRDKNNKIILDSLGNPTFVVRHGDYFHARNSIGPPTQFGQGVGYSTLGYAVRRYTPSKACPDAGCYIIPHYVQWGRLGELFPSPPPPPPH
jgi:hypothetical protein